MKLLHTNLSPLQVNEDAPWIDNWRFPPIPPMEDWPSHDNGSSLVASQDIVFCVKARLLPLFVCFSFSRQRGRIHSASCRENYFELKPSVYTVRCLANRYRLTFRHTLSIVTLWR